MAIHFECPYCKHSLKAPEDAAGHTGVCNQCNNEMIVPEKTEVLVPDKDGKPSKPEGMSDQKGDEFGPTHEKEKKGVSEANTDSMKEQGKGTSTVTKETDMPASREPEDTDPTSKQESQKDTKDMSQSELLALEEKVDAEITQHCE